MFHSAVEQSDRGKHEPFGTVLREGHVVLHIGLLHEDEEGMSHVMPKVPFPFLHNLIAHVYIVTLFHSATQALLYGTFFVSNVT